jgi:hypothetical protein
MDANGLKTFFDEKLFNKFITNLLIDNVRVDILKIIKPTFCHFIMVN